MAWLVMGDRVLASLEIPNNRRARARGLIGRDEPSGAMLLRPCRSVHSFGMRYPIDIAFVDAEGVVITTLTLKPRRLKRPRMHSSYVVEAAHGSFERWGLSDGAELEVKE